MKKQQNKVDRSTVGKLVLFILCSVLCLSTAQAQCHWLRGTVSCEGCGIKDVVVTDGVTSVKTDDKGEYAIQTMIEEGFVYITTPAGYLTEVVDKTIPQFYQKLEKGKDRYDFELIKNKVDDSKHVFFVHSDVQATSKEDLRNYKPILEDCKNLISTYEDVDVFGFDCGDVVGDTPSLFGTYIDVVSELDKPIYRAIGNHDMDYYGRTHETSARTFSSLFGPRYFSFDKGKAHYIVINNNFFIGRDYFYMGYIDEKTFLWLEQDLANVPEGTLVFFIMHIPGRLTDKREPFQYNYDLIANPTVNFEALASILKPYDAHIISGHMHYNLNILHAPNLYEHNTAAICGTWWRGDICTDGTPQGYAIYEVDDKDVKWYYKSSGFPKEHQFKAYPVGASEEYPNDIIVNVWNYDPLWKVEWLENGKVKGQMTKYTGFDPDAKALCSDKDKVKYDWISPSKNEHMFRATPKNSNSQIKIRVTDRFGQVYMAEVK